MSVGDVYYPVAAGYQLALAALILATGRPDLPRAGILLVLGASAFQAIDFFVSGLTGTRVLAQQPLLYVVDGVILLTLPLVLSRYPSSLGGRRGERLGRALWLGALALHTALNLLALAPPWGGTEAAWMWMAPAVAIHRLGLLAAAVILLAHWLPNVLAQRPGPLRTQSLLVGAGIASGLAYTLTLNLWGVVIGVANGWAFQARLPTRLTYVVIPLALVATLAAASALAGAARRERRASFAAAALVVAAGALVGLYDVARPILAFSRGSGEIIANGVRPLLLGIALLRYDLFRVPRGIRAPLLPVTAAFGAASAFVLLLVLFGGASVQADAFDPLSTLLGLLVLFGVVVALREPLADAFRVRANEGDGARARLERYRLALEAARSDPEADAAALERTRRALRVTREQHETLEAILAGNLVVPTVALTGLAPGMRVRERYHVLRELGEGGTGRAHLARDLATGREVVLKEMLRPWEKAADARAAALEREATLSARVASPHVARSLAVLHEPWHTILVREFVPGPTASERLVDGTPAREEALRVVDDVLAGLEAVHAAGALHLDLKPQNVVLTPQGAVLIDLGSGIAVPAVDIERTRAAGSMRVSPAWSPQWAAPEQLEGDAVSARTDIYQAGGLLFFLLAGRPAVEGRGAAGVEAAILAGAPLAWPEDVPAPVRAVVERARARDPARRFASASDMRAALRDAAQARPEAPRRPPGTTVGKIPSTSTSAMPTRG